MNNLIKESRNLPIRPRKQTISISPIVLDSPHSSHALELRVTYPLEGENLPIILLSHGDGPSLYLPSKDGYAPLANFYAEQGFVVIQPTHANSKVGGLPHSHPGAPLFWRSRVEEIKLILDNLVEIEKQAPSLSQRVDHDKIAGVGHSLGGQTMAMLFGTHLTDTKREADKDVSVYEPRIKVGVLLAPPGNGGDELSEFARENFSELNPDYSHLTTKSLVVVGDADQNPFMTVRGPEWYTAAYYEGPGCDHLLTLKGGMHGLGGIAGYDAKETSDEDPDRLEIVRRITSAYLHSALSNDNSIWEDAQLALKKHATNLAIVSSK